MLAPVAEASYGERQLTGLLLASAARWPAFAAELTEATGTEIGYRTEGTLQVGLDRRRHGRGAPAVGVPAGAGPAGDAAAPQPSCATASRRSPRGCAAARSRPPTTRSTPRLLVPALRTAAQRAGAVLVPPAGPAAVRRWTPQVAVVAAGCGAAALTGLPVRPVKGQILRLRAPDGRRAGLPARDPGVRRRRAVYLVPRADGEVVVGATVEERAGHHGHRRRRCYELLRAAIDLVPELAEYELVEAVAGLRPGTPDNAPLLGPLPGRPDVLAATGHYRNGILLTPVTADLIADLVLTGVPDPLLAPFGAAGSRSGDLTDSEEDLCELTVNGDRRASVRRRRVRGATWSATVTDAAARGGGRGQRRGGAPRRLAGHGAARRRPGRGAHRGAGRVTRRCPSTWVARPSPPG